MRRFRPSTRGLTGITIRGTSSPASVRPGWTIRWAATAALAVLLGALSPAAGLAADPTDPASRFELSPIQDEVTPAIIPLGLDPGQPVTVMLKLAGDPVAVRKAKAPGKKVSQEEREAIERGLKAEQESLRDAIVAAGGSVLDEHQDAYNGIAVQIRRDHLFALSSLPNVVAISPIEQIELDNATGVPFIGAPAVWQGVDGLRGEGIKIGIIDTGIDYTHANFAGPGTVAAFQAEDAAAKREEAPNPAFFGPNAPKVKGGVDLVGDDFNSSDPKHNVPHPRPSPLDCNGHGSHVAGTAAGFGVTADGKTYTGPYDAGTPGKSFVIGPGVAPKADLYAIRVFGCVGSTSTDILVTAMDFAVAHDLDVINMSLGAPFGRADSPSAEAAANTAEAGVLVVVSAGNSGPAPYITAAPASGNGTISVAASDVSAATFPGATLALSTDKTITVLNANGAPITAGTTLPVFLLRNPDGSLSLGCSEAEYVDSQISGKLVVTQRGVCARVDRAKFGGKHGAAAVAMINDARGYPPFEGAIAGVTIPFFGVQQSDGTALTAAGGRTATVTPATIPNPGYRAFAGFTSGGPRGGDSLLKPDITAPGVRTNSTAIGTGNGSARFSGTSMAAPHVTGVAALTRQAHPNWDPVEQRAAIVNTADPSQVATYKTSRGGSGLVQALPAVRTMAVAIGEDGVTNLGFGFQELSSDFRGTQKFTVHNQGTAPVTFRLSSQPDGGSPHALSLEPSTVTVGPGDDVSVRATLSVPAATVGDAQPTPANRQAFREVSGVIALTPASSAMNGGASLRMPYYLVPRPRSNVQTEIASPFGPFNPAATARVTNRIGAIAGTADVYAWGLSDERKGLGSIDLRAVGVQSFDFASSKLLVFAMNTFARWSNASVNEFDILVDTTGSGTPNFAVVGADLGLLTGGGFSGEMGSAVINLATKKARVRFFAVAPTDSSTILLPALASDLGLSADSPRFSYAAQSIGLFAGTSDVMAGRASFNAFRPAISQGQSVKVDPNTARTLSLAIDPAEFAISPALGLMVVTLDNAAGGNQAQLLPVTANQEEDQD